MHRLNWKNMSINNYTQDNIKYTLLDQGPKLQYLLEGKEDLGELLGCENNDSNLLKSK